MAGIFSISGKTRSLSDGDLSKETGIPLERVRAIREGKEPFISEIMALSKYTEISTDVYFSKVIFGNIFPGRYISGNLPLKKILQSGNKDAIFYLANSGMLSRNGDDICFSFENEIDPIHPPDRNLVIDLIKELLKNDQPHLAVKLSVKNSYYGIARLSDSICSYETLKAYLFDPHNKGLIRVFAEFFNGLDNDPDKEKLLTEIKEKLESFDSAEYIITDRKKAYINVAVISESGILSTPADKEWTRYDFTKLDSECSLKAEIIKLQDKLFEKGKNYSEVDDIAKDKRRIFLKDIRKEAAILMNCDDEFFEAAGLGHASETEKSLYRKKIREYAAEKIGSGVCKKTGEAYTWLMIKLAENDGAVISRMISGIKDLKDNFSYRRIVKMLGEKSRDSDRLFLTRLWLLNNCSDYQMVIRDVYREVTELLKTDKAKILGGNV